MFIKLFYFLKKIIVSALLIYSFNVFGILLNFSIPINFITVLLIAVFDFPALICLVLLRFSF